MDKLLKIDEFFERFFSDATDLVCDLLQIELGKFKKSLACANVLMSIYLANKMLMNGESLKAVMGFTAGVALAYFMLRPGNPLIPAGQMQLIRVMRSLTGIITALDMALFVFFLLVAHRADISSVGTAIMAWSIYEATAARPPKPPRKQKSAKLKLFALE